MSKQESTEYNGPENNEVYSDTDTYESFEDLDEMDGDPEETEQQSTSSHDGESFEEGEAADEEEAEEKAQKKLIKAQKAKKEAAKKAKGQKSDDLDALDLEKEDSEEEEEEDEEEEEAEEEESEEETEEETAEEKKPEDKKAKGKPTYVTVDGETYALDSSAIISTPVNGKNEKVTLQELKNNYAGKVAYDKKFNEVNLKEQTVKKSEAAFHSKLQKFEGVKKEVDAILADPTKDPQDALKIFLDSCGVDSYDLLERSFKARLSELATVLNMEPEARKNYFLEKKTSHLLDLQKKRDEQSKTDEKTNLYRSKVDALRKSFGVSEAQYVDALEELKSYGEKEEAISERDIVEWAATKPHRETVKGLLKPYEDQLEGDAYGELSWKLANILRTGAEKPDDIKKNLKQIYGVPTEVKQLSKKLNPLGRKGAKKPQPTSSKKKSFESFEDIDDD